MTLNGFVKWLGMRKRRWVITWSENLWSENLRCNGKCPLQVLTRSRRNYVEIARKKYGLSSDAINRIIEASDSYRGVGPERLRARMLRAVGLLQ